MKTTSRRRELLTAAVIAVLATIAVAVAAELGARLVASFLAGAGSAVVIGYVVITNLRISRERHSEQRS